MAARLSTTSTAFVDPIPDPTAGGASSTAPCPTEQRICDNANCSDMNLVSMVPKQNKAQFVIEPKIIEKPLLINGLTTIFQVDGTAAKLSDLKNPDPKADNEPKTIFRVVPNTHVHFVNYVLIDSDDETMRKIKENDSATINKLLESEKAAADEMLRKIMVDHNSNVHVTNVPVTSTQPNMQSNSPADTPVKTNSALPQSNSEFSTNLFAPPLATNAMAAQPSQLYFSTVPMANLSLEPTTTVPETKLEEIQKQLDEIRQSIAILSHSLSKIIKGRQMQNNPASTGH